MKRATVKPLLRSAPEPLKNFETSTRDGYPVVEGLRVDVSTPCFSLKIERRLKFTGTVLRIERETSGVNAGRVLLWIQDEKTGRERPARPMYCTSKNPKKTKNKH